MDRVAEEPNPAPIKGPAWRAAEEFGLDMSLVQDALRKPVWQRIQEHQAALNTLLMLREGYVHQDGGTSADS